MLTPGARKVASACASTALFLTALTARADPSTSASPASLPLADSVEPGHRLLTLSEAVQTALHQQPNVRVAAENTEAAAGRADQARSPLLPQVQATLSYLRSTGNYTPKPGSTPTTVGIAPSNWDTYNYYNGTVSANQLIYDFGQTWGHWKSTEASRDSLRATERTTAEQVVLSASVAYFQVSAQKALIKVAEETLENYRKHYVQAEAGVKVGTRPEIDLAQATTDVANAKVLLINAQNAYDIGKVQLNQTMGILGDTNYDVTGDESEPIAREDAPVEDLLAEAMAQRPEAVSLEKLREADDLNVRSIKGGYGPSLGATSAASIGGTQLGSLGPNFYVGLTATWNIYQGGLTNGQVREAVANLHAVEAQIDALRLQIRVDVDSARLSIRAGKTSISAQEEVVKAAAVQLKLAEGRYAAGVGSVIELGDAQVGYTNAQAQLVQARFTLSTARAQLRTALGR